MADANEKDEAPESNISPEEDAPAPESPKEDTPAPKSNISPEEDAPQSEITPSALTILSNMEDEEEDEDEEIEDEEDYDDEEEEEDEEESEEEGEDELVNNGGSAMLVVDEEASKVNAVKEDEKKAVEQKNGDELGENSKRREKRARHRNRNKKDAQKESATLAVVKDKPESSIKKKGSKRVESMGMVFMCSSKTKTDCFRYKVLGLPGNKKDQVAKIYKGMRLFLFDVDLRLMYGIFKAAGPGGYNLEPKAFKSEYPSQVRFIVLDDCLPVAEENFKATLKENYYTRNKFEGLLKAEQVKKLCKLFVAANRGTHTKPAIKPTTRPPRTRPVEDHRIRGVESRRSRADEPHVSRPREKRKRQVTREEERRPRSPPRREEERRPRSPPRREKRRYSDYERPPVLYEREPRVSYECDPPAVYEREPPAVYEREPVPRYLPPLHPVTSPVRYYERPLDTAPYVRERVPEHHAYRVIDVDLSRERERDPYATYSREPPSYRDSVYTLPPEYRLVTRDYHPPVVQAPEYRLSGGSHLPSYRDVELAPDYRSSAPSLPEYRSRTHYRY